MENTCCFEKCEFAKILMLSNPNQCMNYIESMWMKGPMDGSAGGSRPKLVNDCAPKRTFLMVQELYARQIGTQQAVEQIRNEIQWTEVVANVVGKNLGLDLEKFVSERQRLIEVNKIRQIAASKQEFDDIVEGDKQLKEKNE